MRVKFDLIFLHVLLKFLLYARISSFKDSIKHSDYLISFELSDESKEARIDLNGFKGL